MTSSPESSVWQWIVNIGLGVIMTLIGFVVRDHKKQTERNTERLDEWVPEVAKLVQSREDQNTRFDRMDLKQDRMEAKLDRLLEFQNKEK